MIPQMTNLNDTKNLSHQSLHFFVGDSNTPACLLYKDLDGRLFQSTTFIEVKLGDKNEIKSNT